MALALQQLVLLVLVIRRALDDAEGNGRRERQSGYRRDTVCVLHVVALNERLVDDRLIVRKGLWWGASEISHKTTVHLCY